MSGCYIDWSDRNCSIVFAGWCQRAPHTWFLGPTRACLPQTPPDLDRFIRFHRARRGVLNTQRNTQTTQRATRAAMGHVYACYACDAAEKSCVRAVAYRSTTIVMITAMLWNLDSARGRNRTTLPLISGLLAQLA